LRNVRTLEGAPHLAAFCEMWDPDHGHKIFI